MEHQDSFTWDDSLSLSINFSILTHFSLPSQMKLFFVEMLATIRTFRAALYVLLIHLCYAEH